ncbi:dihydropyrimidinase [Pseudorhodoplanes sp.]|uniref:dihydropyrimidinase n=1 Tax=Pseudorhodoplanes sp. TaxID=1934341 RepID=UPI003D0D29B2
MSEFDLIIHGGTVATAADTSGCDIGVKGGKIVALADHLAGASRKIDARGKIVTPGGIDGHCHIAQLTANGVWSADDFKSGSLSAVFGGTTTIIPFAAQNHGESLRQVVDAYHKSADGQSIIDYAFHLIVSDPTPQVLGQELPALIRNGYTSLKVYLTYAARKLTDHQMLDVLAVARREGALVMVHAENNDAIEWLTERLLEAGKTEPKYMPLAHTMATEREATHRAITLAEIADVPILIVHVSGREAAEQVAWGRNKGLKIFAETCPQYLFLTEDDFDKEHFHGAKFMCSPPPRDKANQEVIWRGLQNGLFHIVSSDHAPYRFDKTGKMFNGDNPPFPKVPNGIPGLETRMPLLFSAGVSEGRISLNEFVALTSTNVAKLYGLYPRKGTIAIGSDADLVVWDPERRVTIDNALLHHNVDYTPYEGITVRGWPDIVISRGDIVCDHGKLTAPHGRGVFLPCERSSLAGSVGHGAVGAG